MQDNEVIRILNELGFPVHRVSSSGRPEIRPRWEVMTDIIFHAMQMESKEGALSPFNGRFPSSAPRTGQATLRCIRLASEDLAPSPCRWRSGSSTRCESL